MAAEIFPDIGKLRQVAQTHNLALLLVLSGLRPAYMQTKATHQLFLKFDRLLWSWSEQLRYRLPGQVSIQDIQQFIEFLSSPDGLLQWINKS